MALPATNARERALRLLLQRVAAPLFDDQLLSAKRTTGDPVSGENTQALRLSRSCQKPSSSFPSFSSRQRQLGQLRQRSHDRHGTGDCWLDRVAGRAALHHGGPVDDPAGDRGHRGHQRRGQPAGRLRGQPAPRKGRLGQLSRGRRQRPPARQLRRLRSDRRLRRGLRHGADRFAAAETDGPPVDCESVEERAPNSFRPPDTPPDPEPEQTVPPQVAPPTTRLRRLPRALLFAAGQRRLVTFAFEASEPGARFRCRLDRQPFRPCRSPRRPCSVPAEARAARETAATRSTSRPAARRWPAGAG
jgi:hypothetical protein